MKKQIISFITAAAMLPCISPPTHADDFRHGCTLMPLSYDRTGTKPDSAYILSGCTEQPTVRINEDISTTVTKQTDGSYLITPDAPLEYNSLYTFTLDGDEPVSWTFQTADKFCITNTLPGTNSSNVPRNTGIELTFSHEDFNINDVAKSVAFKPKLEGKWEKHKATAVFVPKDPLSYSSEYTVSISTNMHKGNEYLDEEYSFSFTTEEMTDPKVSQNPDKKPTLWLGTAYADYREVGTAERPEVKLTVFGHRDMALSAKIQSELYPLPTDAALKYLDRSVSISEIAQGLGSPSASMTTAVSLTADESYKEVTVPLPDKLRQGFYLIKSVMGEYTHYSVIQATDLSVYAASDNEKFGIWVNNYISGQPVEGVKIFTGNEKTDLSTGTDGCAVIQKGDFKYIKLEKDNMFGYYPIGNEPTENQRYRSAIITDRALYKDNDTVYFWGTARDFESGEPLKTLKAELYSSSHWRYNTGNSPIEKTELKYNDNSFDGAMKLPNLSAGTYVLRIKNGSKVITETFISIEDYVKPDYKMSISTDKKAIFLGDSINYTINTAFFEGTPLPDLDISWGFSNYAYKDARGEVRSDKSGNSVVSITPELSDNAKYLQGEIYAGISAYATLPECGDISAYGSSRVFMNNVTSDIKSEYKDGASTVNVHMDTITLDRLNDGTAAYWNDYIDKPDAGRNIRLELIYNYYSKTRSGTRYDYINKKTVSTYHYSHEQQTVDTKNLTTDSDGNITYSFKPDRPDEGWYTLLISCTDDLGRKYSKSAWIQTKKYRWQGIGCYDSESYSVLTDKDKYCVGDEAVINVMKGTSPAKDKILYIKDCNGIKDMCVTDNGEYRSIFNEIPGAYISCIIFEPGVGYRLINNYTYLPYDYEQNRLNIEIKADKDSYSPGDDTELTISVKGKDGAAKDADICLSLVDEALLALRDNSTDILKDIYTRISRESRSAYFSHTISYYYSSSDKSGGGGGGGVSNSLAAPAAIGGIMETADEASDSSARVRSDFRDTAVFLTAKTDKDGIAKLSFTLPDNITSWRASVSAVTAGLDAGGETCPIKVSLPAFLSYNMSDSYIVGDTPIIGVNLYGSGLDASETAEFIIDDGENTYTAQGHPFERVNIPISTMNTEGKKSLTVTAKLNGKELDAVKSEFEVVDTYNSTDIATYYDSPYDAINTGDGHNVNIIFTDKSRAALLGDIMHMRYIFGNRLDQRISHLTAINLLNDYYSLTLPPPATEWKNYQSDDGGLKLLSYGNSDLDATAKLTPYIKDKIDKYALIDYLNANKTQIKALYALACLRQPVLNELEKYAAAENLSPAEYLYIILAYCELGEMGKAADIWNKHIDPIIEDATPDKRIRAGSDNDDILEATALAAVAALYIRDDAEQFYRYCTRNYTKDILINIEKLMYISTAVKTLPQESGTIKYRMFDEEYTKTFRCKESFSLCIPAQKLSDFKVTEASDSVQMMSVASEKLAVDKIDNPDIDISRRYCVARTNKAVTEFNETDIVKIEIQLRFGAQLEDGGYTITDYLPSGLRLIDNGLRNVHGDWAISSDGQKITLYSYNGTIHNNDTVCYYARVVNPGSYTADNATVQNNKSAELIAATDRTEITIKSSQ